MLFFNWSIGHFLYHLGEFILGAGLIFGLITLLVYADKRGVKTYSSGSVKPLSREEKQQAKRLMKDKRRKSNKTEIRVAGKKKR